MDAIVMEVPDFPEHERGYRLSAQRISDLMAEYVRYRTPDGSVPQPYLDIISALSELAAYRKYETISRSEQQRHPSSA